MLNNDLIYMYDLDTPYDELNTSFLSDQVSLISSLTLLEGKLLRAYIVLSFITVFY